MSAREVRPPERCTCAGESCEHERTAALRERELRNDKRFLAGPRAPREAQRGREMQRRFAAGQRPA